MLSSSRGQQVLVLCTNLVHKCIHHFTAGQVAVGMHHFQDFSWGKNAVHLSQLIHYAFSHNIPWFYQWGVSSQIWVGSVWGCEWVKQYCHECNLGLAMGWRDQGSATSFQKLIHSTSSKDLSHRTHAHLSCRNSHPRLLLCLSGPLSNTIWWSKTVMKLHSVPWGAAKVSPKDGWSLQFLYFQLSLLIICHSLDCK